MLVHLVLERPREKDKKAWCRVKFRSSLAWMWVMFHTFQFEDDHLSISFHIVSSFHSLVTFQFAFHCNIWLYYVVEMWPGMPLRKTGSNSTAPYSSIQLHTAEIRNPSLNLWQVTERKALSRISLWGPEVSYLLNTETSGPHNATTSSPRGTVPNPLSFWVYNDFIMA